jgi:hypothetical protein
MTPNGSRTFDNLARRIDMANWMSTLVRTASVAVLGLVLLAISGCSEPAKKTPAANPPKVDANPKHGEPGHKHVDGDEHEGEKAEAKPAAPTVDEDLKASDAATGEPKDPLDTSDSGPSVEKGEPKDIDLPKE